MPVDKRAALERKLRTLQILIDERTEPDGPEVEVIVLTALETPELSSLQGTRSVSCQWKSFQLPADNQIWHKAALQRHRDGREIGVVAGAAPSMGLPAMALLAAKAIFCWKPRLLILAGIAAGVRGRVLLGDLLIPDRVFVHDSGKVTHDGNGRRCLAPDRWTQLVSQDVLADVRSKRDVCMSAIRDVVLDRSFGSSSTSHRHPEIHVGPLASGNSVIDSEAEVNRIAAGDRKLIGIDMEAYSLIASSVLVTSETVHSLVVKGVSDFAMKKNDRYRTPAAIASAEFVMQYISRSSLLD